MLPNKESIPLLSAQLGRHLVRWNHKSRRLHLRRHIKCAVHDKQSVSRGFELAL